MPAKFDFKQELGPLYRASAARPARVEAPVLDYLMIDGSGDPETTPAFNQAIEALFAVSYAAKFLVKKGSQGIDYTVMPLQGLWWADDMRAFADSRRDEWRWTLMILQPPVAGPMVIEEAISETQRKKALPALEQLRLAQLAEGSCVQILHIGPFHEEPATIQRLHRHIEEQGWRPRGKHHEIYLSDMRRAAPSNWKTILRQPIRDPADGEPAP